jgi:hypothetical protein
VDGKKGVGGVCLRLATRNKRNLRKGCWWGGVKTVVYAVFEMIVDDGGELTEDEDGGRG